MLQEQDVHGGSAEGEILGKRSGFAPSSGPQTPPKQLIILGLEP
jgi:hypothetical protein